MEKEKDRLTRRIQLLDRIIQQQQWLKEKDNVVVEIIGHQFVRSTVDGEDWVLFVVGDGIGVYSIREDKGYLVHARNIVSVAIDPFNPLVANISVGKRQVVAHGGGSRLLMLGKSEDTSFEEVSVMFDYASVRNEWVVMIRKLARDAWQMHAEEDRLDSHSKRLVISNPEIFQKFVVCKDSSKPKSADKALLYSKQWVYFADLDSNPVFTISSVNTRFPISCIDSIILGLQDQYYLQFTIDLKRANAQMDEIHISEKKLSKIVIAYLRSETDCWSIVNDLRHLFYKLRKSHLQIAEADSFSKRSISNAVSRDSPDTLAGYLTKVSKGGTGKSVIKLVRFCPSTLTIQWAGKNEAKGERVLSIELNTDDLKKDFSEYEANRMFILETTLKKLVFMTCHQYEYKLWTEYISNALNKKPIS